MAAFGFCVHSASSRKADDRHWDGMPASGAGSAQLREGRGRARTSGSLSGSSSTRSICLMPSMSCPRLSCCAGAAAAGAGAGAGAGGRGAAPTGGGGPTGGGRCGAVLKPAGGTGAGAWPVYTRRKLTTGPAVLGCRLASLHVLGAAAQAHKTRGAADSTPYSAGPQGCLAHGLLVQRASPTQYSAPVMLCTWAPLAK